MLYHVHKERRICMRVGSELSILGFALACWGVCMAAILSLFADDSPVTTAKCEAQHWPG